MTQLFFNWLNVSLCNSQSIYFCFSSPKSSAKFINKFILKIVVGWIHLSFLSIAYGSRKHLWTSEQLYPEGFAFSIERSFLFCSPSMNREILMKKKMNKMSKIGYQIHIHQIRSETKFNTRNKLVRSKQFPIKINSLDLRLSIWGICGCCETRLHNNRKQFFNCVDILNENNYTLLSTIS